MRLGEVRWNGAGKAFHNAVSEFRAFLRGKLFSLFKKFRDGLSYGMRIPANRGGSSGKTDMMNITLSADESLIELARETARERKTTLNQLFRNWLVELAGRRERDERLAALVQFFEK